MEFQLRKQRSQPHRVTFTHTKRVEIQLDRHVLADSHQIPTQPCGVGIGEQRLASTFALYLRCVLENGIEVAKLFDQLPGCLITDSLHPWHVVRRIADHRQVVNHPLGRHSQPVSGVLHGHKFLLHRRRASPPGVQQRNRRPNQLIEILVSGHNDRVHTRRTGKRRQRADYIVRLITVYCNEWDAERFQELLDPLDRTVESILQLRVQLLAGRLVLGIGLLAEGRSCIMHPY